MRIPSELEVCLVAGDPGLHEQLRPLFRAAGATLRGFDSAEALFAAMGSARPGCMAVSAVLPGMSGIELMHALQRRDPGLPVVVIVEPDDVDAAVAAVRMGAAEVLEQPVSAQRLVHSLVAVARACDPARCGC